jgi:hypothetical protein
MIDRREKNDAQIKHEEKIFGHDKPNTKTATKKIPISLEGIPLNDLEGAEVIDSEYRFLEKDMDYSGAFESDVIEPTDTKEEE